MTSGVSIVIPTWNGLDLLKQFLPSVKAAASHYSKQSNAPTEIIIVDDGSDDATIDWLIAEGFGEWGGRAADPWPVVSALLFVKNQTNRGFGETCNRGFEAARFPLVLLLN